MVGRFLALEGIDGCGKTTQLRHLADWLPASGLMPSGATLHLTREPGGTPLGRALRELLLNPPQESAPAPTAELLLYAADRAQHVERMIRPALQRGDWVLSDRFSGSTIAYQGDGRGLDLQTILDLERIATVGVTPDLTFWLDLPLQESLKRRGARSDDRIEAEGEAFLARVSEGFQRLSAERGWTAVAADQSADQVQQLIRRRLRDWLAKASL
ncbi:dTMP kinase [Synechococcus sp. BIOS-E4-1]|uniref:dTMP kinase n=1 Tax=Synechococcus sp. BIOS-E4-1 TaxID=1400864 RepID=UPI001646D91B|nr:dTMP kinase [Synechococcus sp. BIOS-E4-1]QNI56562.1 dTMP kinase [Synechococcus sp. BIOS-E4-1]